MPGRIEYQEVKIDNLVRLWLDGVRAKLKADGSALKVVKMATYVDATSGTVVIKCLVGEGIHEV